MPTGRSARQSEVGHQPNSLAEAAALIAQRAATSAPTPALQAFADDALSDFAYPQREAAFFYGLFLRGHSPEQLRRDIAVPPEVLARWTREIERWPEARPVFDRIVEFRRQVLAIFDSLVTNDTRGTRLQ
ncbi:MAG: hypothetical protein ACRD6I_08380 [Candidatus Acidiferrales bacterium]